MLRPAVFASVLAVSTAIVVAAPASAATPPGNGYAAGPAQIGPSGASTPSGCPATSSSGTAPSTAGGQTTAAGAGTAAKASTASAGGSNTSQVTGRETMPLRLSPSGSGSSGAPLWIGLVHLLALLFLLLGFASGRRRPARATA